MYRANRSFDFDGEQYVAGITHVADDHPAYRAHPEFFDQPTASTARRVRSAIRSNGGDLTPDEVGALLQEAARTGHTERGRMASHTRTGEFQRCR